MPAKHQKVGPIRCHHIVRVTTWESLFWMMSTDFIPRVHHQNSAEIIALLLLLSVCCLRLWHFRMSCLYSLLVYTSWDLSLQMLCSSFSFFFFLDKIFNLTFKKPCTAVVCMHAYIWYICSDFNRDYNPVFTMENCFLFFFNLNISLCGATRMLIHSELQSGTL